MPLADLRHALDTAFPSWPIGRIDLACHGAGNATGAYLETECPSTDSRDTAWWPRARMPGTHGS
eukprot:5655253-Alexandrium_andersonii.AAC.1